MSEPTNEELRETVAMLIDSLSRADPRWNDFSETIAAADAMLARYKTCGQCKFWADGRCGWLKTADRPIWFVRKKIITWCPITAENSDAAQDCPTFTR